MFRCLSLTAKKKEENEGEENHFEFFISKQINIKCCHSSFCETENKEIGRNYTSDNISLQINVELSTVVFTHIPLMLNLLITKSMIIALRTF